MPTAPQNSIKEARILESLSHPNIIAYLDSFVDDQDLMIVCEWAEVGATVALFRCWLSLQWMCIPGNKTYSLTQIHTGWRSQVPGSQSAEQGHPLPRIHHMEIFPANCQRFVWCWCFLVQQDRNNQCSNPIEPAHETAHVLHGSFFVLWYVSPFFFFWILEVMTNYLEQLIYFAFWAR